jgi:hypothetical protein
MGTHKKPITKEIIEFIMQMGKALTYAVNDEEPMFPSSQDSPILDITWRK